MKPFTTLLFFIAISILPVVGIAAQKSLEKSPIESPGQYLGDQHELLNLKQYLALAAENNNELQAAFQQWQAAAKRAVRADTLPDPRFSFGYYTTPLETRGGPARYKYGLSQTLPFFGKLDFKEQMALREADGFKAKFDDLKLSIFNEVKKVYYEYAYLAQAIESTSENIELVRYLEKIATARYTTGAAGHSDIIRPQVELGKLEDRLGSLQALQAPLVTRLNALMDRPASTPIPFPASVPVMVIKASEGELQAILQTASPKLLYWETVESREEAGKDLAERNYYPDFTFGIETTEVDRARNPGVTGDGANPVMASMSFNIPIWLEARDSAVQESQARILAARKSRTGLARQLSADLALAHYRYLDAGRKIGLYRDTLVPKAEQALGVTMEAFMTGTGSALDLISAEQTLLELKLAYYRALTDQALGLAEMERLVGRELPCAFHGSLLKRSPPHE
ncbi:TolC family protein [Pseudodesulfovibrio tunisiensis]|uniref:TolC family protein n=1 Tax=Pseudodesulfovibrio tunisiensis TaxID=463192 RepID=UPI001FB547BF|nr:TolC family protein [Pseudodesulfovibrio tunisiensis]